MRQATLRPPFTKAIAIGLLAAALTVFSQQEAPAQAYPTRSPTVIVPFAPGAGADISARIAAEYMGRVLGVQIVVENVAGAGGTTGTTRSARSAPDGYTIALGHMGTHAASVALYPNLAYNPVEDFIPIGLIADQPMTLVVRKDFPAANLQEFVAYAKANEAKLNGSHAGVGSVSYTTCLMLNDAMKTKTTMVPFGGTGPAMNAVIGGQVDYLCDTVLGAVPQVQAGTVRALAVATTKRNPALPDLPTSAEGGLPAFQSAPFYGLFVPKGTPQPIVDKLADALDKALDDEGARKRLLDLGAVIPEKPQRGSAALLALVKSEIERLTPIIKAATADGKK
jgi:tripartite-type tricarboxylate transporter receptor subunit TctC